MRTNPGPGPFDAVIRLDRDVRRVEKIVANADVGDGGRLAWQAEPQAPATYEYEKVTRKIFDFHHC